MAGYLKVMWLFWCVAWAMDPHDEDGRLPDIIRPSNYRVTLYPILEQNERLCGHVWIDFVVVKAANFLLLNGVDLTILEAVIETGNYPPREDPADQKLVEDLCRSGIYGSMMHDGSRRVAFQNIHVNPETQQIALLLPGNMTLRPGTHQRIGITYTGKVYDTSHGFYRSSYTDGDCCCKRWVGATQMEATNARRVFPCFDEPQSKVSFQLIVGHSKSMTALANMPLQRTEPMELVDDAVWSHFEKTPLMSTYLVAVTLLTGDYTYVERYHTSCKGEVRLRFWSRSRDVKHLELAAFLAPKMIAFLEQYLDEPLTVSKLDFVPVPMAPSFNAMENWGLILIDESYFFYDDQGSGSVHLVARTLAHELAHQWIGNLVTVRWWDDIWLTEGLSTFFESLILNDVLPELTADMKMQQSYQHVMAVDLVRQSHSMQCNLRQAADIREVFDSITYTKGAAIMRMTQNFVGRDLFRQGLRTFVKKFKFASANGRQFWLTIDETATDALKSATHLNAIMETWTTQSGYPLVTCNRTEDGRIVLTQEPFDPKSAHESSDQTIDKCVPTPDRPRWWVPVSMTNSESVRCNQQNASIVWIPPDSGVQVINPVSRDQWIVANFEFGGYFRVNYDADNWDLLARQLALNHTAIPAVTRAHLIEDAFVLAHYDIVGYDVPLKLTQYMHNEEDLTIKSNVHGHVRYVAEMSPDEAERARFQQYLQYLGTPQSVMYVVHGRLGGHHLNSSDVLIAENCAAGETHCKREALDIYRRLMEDNANPEDLRLEADRLRTVWCAAIRFGGIDEWDFAWTRSLRPESDRTTILPALGCSQQPEKLKKLLSRILDGRDSARLRPDEVVAVLESMADNSVARSMTLQFIMINWDSIVNQLGQSRALKLLATGARYSNSADVLHRIERFLTEPVGRRSAEIDGVLATVRFNLRWLKKR